MTQSNSAGARFRRALAEEQPLQIMGTINAYTAMMAEQVGYRAIYLSGGGVAGGGTQNSALSGGSYEDEPNKGAAAAAATGGTVV